MGKGSAGERQRKERICKRGKEKRGGWGVSDEEIEVRCAIGGVGEWKNYFFWIFFKKKFVLCL